MTVIESAVAQNKATAMIFKCVLRSAVAIEEFIAAS